MKSQFTLTAVLTTMSPMHITEPGDYRVDLNGKTTDKGFPCPRTTKMWLSTRPMVSELSAAGDDEEGEGGASQRPVPCIPSNSLRGQLRRQAARDITDALLARGEQLSINAYNVLQCGAATGNPDGNGPSVAEAVLADAHPYFGLFGGGPRLIRSNLRVDTALAVTETSLPYLRPGFEAAMSPAPLTSIGWVRRNDDALMLTDVEYQTQVIASSHAALNSHQDAAAAARKAKDEDEPSAEKEARGLQSFNAMEYVRPGVHFALRFDVDGTEAQAGLMLKSLLGVLKANRIGGGGRRGFGRFILQSVKLVENDETHAIGERLSDDNPSFTGRGAELIAAWEAERAQLRAGDIESMAKPADKPPAAKKTKAAAATAA